MTHTHEFVEAEYLKGNIKLLSVYIGAKYNNDLECLECKFLWKATYANFRRENCGCPKCSGLLKHTQEFVEAEYLKANIKLLSFYVNSHVKNNLECLKFGHKWKANYHNFQNDNSGCPECWRLLNRGENHSRWNHDLTKEDRKNSRDRTYIPDNRLWRKIVFDRDKDTCQFCGSSISGTLVAHHIDSWKEHQDDRFNVDNGVTLCETCHKACHAYHILLGYRSANYKSFYQWMVKYSVIKPENWLWTVRYPDSMNKTIEFFNQPSQKLAIYLSCRS